MNCEFHPYYLQIFIVFVDYNERNDLLEPVNPKAKQVPIRRETVRSLMDSMGNSLKHEQSKMFEIMALLFAAY